MAVCVFFFFFFFFFFGGGGKVETVSMRADDFSRAKISKNMRMRVYIYIQYLFQNHRHTHTHTLQNMVVRFASKLLNYYFLVDVSQVDGIRWSVCGRVIMVLWPM